MNHIIAICNIVECKNFTLQNPDGHIPNIASAQGIPLETFVRAIFCGIPGNTDSFLEMDDIFAHTGSTNNPPDAMIKNGGDAIEIKKVEKQKSDIVLNSSLPKTKIFVNDKMINSSARGCEEWESRDLLYVVGHVPSGTKTIKSIFFFYGDCYAKKNTFYKDKFQEIKSRVTSTGEISSEGNEYGTLKNVDGLGNGVYMRVRPINGMHSPWKIFSEYVELKEHSKFTLVSIMRKNKYDSFPKKDRERLEHLPVEKNDIEITNPDLPKEKIKAVIIKFSIDQL
jgi:hypothetical protein